MIKMLLVEDDKSVLEALKDTLSEEGYDIDTTDNGTDALQYITKKQYDVIISDMNLGDTSGINILKASRNMNRDIKFIMITAYSSIETAIEAIRYGVYDYIIKPFDSTELKFRVRQAIEKLEADRQRRHIDERYRIIMDNVPFGIAIISPEMEIVEVNKQVAKWFPDIDTTETPPCFTVFCVPPQDKICHECAVEKAIKTGKKHTQLRYIPCNGKNCKIKSTANPIFDESGNVISVLKVMEEIE